MMSTVPLVIVCWCMLTSLGESLAIPLLVPDQTGLGMTLHPLGVSMLRTITKPIALVVVAGPTRGGKSFSLDVILNTEHEYGFGVGDKAESKTIGAVLWSTPLAECDDYVILVLDTEGLNAKPSSRDKAVLVTSLLVGSRFVYHDDGWIGYPSVVSLHSVATLATHYARKDKAIRDASVKQVLPYNMVWVIQRYKFASDLNEMNTARDVLFRVMLAEQPNPTESAAIDMFNKTVRAIKTMVPSHSAYFIPSAESDIVQGVGPNRIPLSSVPIANLPAAYLTEMTALRNDLANCDATRPKGITIQNGNDLIDLITIVLAHANEEIDYIGDKVVANLAHRYIGVIIGNLTHTIDAFPFPFEHDVLAAKLVNLSNAARTMFAMLLPTISSSSVDQVINDATDVSVVYTRDLELAITNVRAEANTKNMRASDDLCGKLVTINFAILASQRTIHGMAGDVTKFDAFFEQLMVQFLQECIGPAANKHTAVLIDDAAIARKMVVMDGGPRRKLIWLVISICTLLVISAAIRPSAQLLLGCFGFTKLAIVIDIILVLAMIMCVSSIVLVALSLWNVSSLFDDITVLWMSFTSDAPHFQYTGSISDLSIGDPYQAIVITVISVITAISMALAACAMRQPSVPHLAAGVAAVPPQPDPQTPQATALSTLDSETIDKISF